MIDATNVIIHILQLQCYRKFKSRILLLWETNVRISNRQQVWMWEHQDWLPSNNTV